MGLSCFAAVGSGVTCGLLVPAQGAALGLCGNLSRVWGACLAAGEPAVESGVACGLWRRALRKVGPQLWVLWAFGLTAVGCMWGCLGLPLESLLLRILRSHVACDVMPALRKVQLRVL